jgi:hypothetical protein
VQAQALARAEAGKVRTHLPLPALAGWAPPPMLRSVCASVCAASTVCAALTSTIKRLRGGAAQGQSVAAVGLTPRGTRLGEIDDNPLATCRAIVEQSRRSQQNRIFLCSTPVFQMWYCMINFLQLTIRCMRYQEETVGSCGTRGTCSINRL